MHTAAKAMFIVGGLLCVIGGIFFVGGAETAEIDIENEAAWSGSSGTWDFEDDDLYFVYVKSGTLCEDFSATMTDQNGTTGNWLEDNIDIDDCEDWEDSDDIDGFMSIGHISASVDEGLHTINASSKIYIIGGGEELGEAIGGGLAMLGGSGVLCCGGFFVLLGIIFAFTLKKAEPQIVVVNQQPLVMGNPAMTQMGAPQVQQPPQGGI